MGREMMNTSTGTTTNGCHEKKSSTTAKTALGLAIGGLSLAAVQGSNGGNGILGNLFGGTSTYEQEKIDKGAAAATELNILEKWIMPVMGQVCNLQTEVAVNKAVDMKNQEITGLLFREANSNTQAKFDLAQCRTDGVFAVTNQKVNDAFELANVTTDYKIERATCNTIKGTPYISPQQMADPYRSASNYLLTQQVPSNFSTCTNSCYSDLLF